jgi:hypothetical protein
MKLEFVEALQVAHPFVKGFDQTYYVIGEAELNAIAGGETSDVVSKRTAADIEGVEDGRAVFTTTFYIGLQVEPKPGKHARTTTAVAYLCIRPSRICWAKATRYFLSDRRIREDGQTLGDLQTPANGNQRSSYQEVFPRAPE